MIAAPSWFTGESAHAWADGYNAALADRGAALDQARRDGAAEALDQARTEVLAKMDEHANLATEDRDTYGDGYLSGLAEAIYVLYQRARAAALAEQGDG